MSSSESSELSPSPPASPEASFHGPPSLERLVIHFVSAKKALASTQHVIRATELVTSSRSLIEDIAILGAKNSFARRGVDEQVETLYAIKHGVAEITHEADDGFQATISRLDGANDRLQTALASLRSVIVDTSMPELARGSEHRAKFAEEYVDEDPVGPAKTLLDFVDESTHEELLDSLRTLIDSFNSSRSDLDHTLQQFEESITAVSEAVHPAVDHDSPHVKPTIYDEPLQPLPTLFQSMEDHAGEMASLLQSMISHYDLCVSALKHTEGGREAARQAVLAGGDDLLKSGGGSEGMEESLYGAKMAEPISDKERAEMLRVLEGDATELDDVVNELRDRGTEMEGLYSQLDQRADTARKDMKRLRHALGLLYHIRDSLSTYLNAATHFRESWTTIQTSITSKTKELTSLRTFYEQFLTGYKKLLREVDRRRAAEEQMVKVAERARKDLNKLYDADRKAREEFVEDVGGFLPGDLWPGLADGGFRWVVTALLPHDNSTHHSDMRQDVSDHE